MVATAPGIKEVEAVFGQVILTGRIVTMDALLTQRQVAQTIVEAGGDYVMIVKDNQPQLTADIELVFTLPPPASAKRVCTRWISAMGASKHGISRRVRHWWATAIGRVWRRCAKSGSM
jgi:hypothetical protein